MAPPRKQRTPSPRGRVGAAAKPVAKPAPGSKRSSPKAKAKPTTLKPPRPGAKPKAGSFGRPTGGTRKPSFDRVAATDQAVEKAEEKRKVVFAKQIGERDAKWAQALEVLAVGELENARLDSCLVAKIKLERNYATSLRGLGSLAKPHESPARGRLGLDEIFEVHHHLGQHILHFTGRIEKEVLHVLREVFKDFSDTVRFLQKRGADALACMRQLDARCAAAHGSFVRVQTERRAITNKDGLDVQHDLWSAEMNYRLCLSYAFPAFVKYNALYADVLADTIEAETHRRKAVQKCLSQLVKLEKTVLQGGSQEVDSTAMLGMQGMDPNTAAMLGPKIGTSEEAVLNLEREELKLRDQLEAIYALGLDYSVGDPDEGKNVKMGPPLQTPLVSAKYKGKYKKPGMMTSWHPCIVVRTSDNNMLFFNVPKKDLETKSEDKLLESLVPAAPMPKKHTKKKKASGAANVKPTTPPKDPKPPAPKPLVTPDLALALRLCSADLTSVLVSVEKADLLLQEVRPAKGMTMSSETKKKFILSGIPNAEKEFCVANDFDGK